MCGCEFKQGEPQKTPVYRLVGDLPIELHTVWTKNIRLLLSVALGGLGFCFA